jgi:tetratricopeptide (TPR) repeat protein
VYYTLDSWAAAIADYDVVLDLKPDYYDAMVYRGSAYHYLENYDAALADFERAITMDAAHAHAFVQRGQTYQTLGDLALAQADWETAINMGIEKTETTAIASLPDNRDAEIAENGLQLNYTFTGTAGMVITVKLTAARDSGFDGMMLLRGPDDKPLTLSDDAYDKGYDPLIEAFELPETGDYTLVVVGFDGTSTGAFNLKLTTGTPSK